MGDILKNSITAFKNSSIRVKAVVAVAVATLTVSSVASALNVRFAYGVLYNDEVVGYVSDTSDVEQVEDEVLENIKAEDPSEYMGDTEARLSLTVGGRIASNHKVAETILLSSDDLVPAAVLKVNGETVMAVDCEDITLRGIANYTLNRFSTGDEKECSFALPVTVEDGYYPQSMVCSLSEASDYLHTLDVKTVKTEKYVSELPFETVRTESNSYLKGYVRVTSAGVNGSADVTADVTYLNGVEAGRVILESVTLTEPVAQQETVGTATVSKTESAQYASGKAMFCWPLERVSRQRITSYWGDGRGHKAIDISTPTGTAVYAGLGGTVTKAMYRSDYGYFVVIDHGNGYSTLYAHTSELFVSVGQVVEKGEKIAHSGSTGQSTGPHLHFEVRINGVRVNPMGYIEQ